MAAARIRRVAQAQQRQAEKQQRRRLRKKKAEAKRRRGRPKQKRYYAKSQFSLKRLRKLLNNIEIVIIVALPDEPFTKDPERMYSYYQFQPVEIRLNPDGTLKGGILTFTFAWIDWSFVRLLVPLSTRPRTRAAICGIRSPSSCSTFCGSCCTSPPVTSC